MKRIDKIIVFWGVCDIFFIVGLIASSLLKGEVPLYNDLESAIINTIIVPENFTEMWGFIVFTFLDFIFTVSILASGISLILRKKIGLLLAYCQTPYRVFTVVPSIGFILFSFDIFESDFLFWGMVVFYLTESLKILTLIKWQRYKKNLLTN